MAVYLPIRALNRSSAVRINGQKIVPGVTAYVDISASGVAKELAYHSAIGQVFVVGALTGSSLDQIVVSGGTVTNGAGLTVNVAAGELRTRSTGVFVAGAAATNFALTVADGTQDRTDL